MARAPVPDVTINQGLRGWAPSVCPVPPVPQAGLERRAGLVRTVSTAKLAPLAEFQRGSPWITQREEETAPRCGIRGCFMQTSDRSQQGKSACPPLS